MHIDYFYFENGFKKLYSNGENYSHKRTTEISGGKKIKNKTRFQNQQYPWLFYPGGELLRYNVSSFACP